MAKEATSFRLALQRCSLHVRFQHDRDQYDVGPHELTHPADIHSRRSFDRPLAVRRSTQAIGDLIRGCYPPTNQPAEVVATLGEMLASQHPRNTGALAHLRDTVAPKLAARGASGTRALVATVRLGLLRRVLLNESDRVFDLPDARAASALIAATARATDRQSSGRPATTSSATSGCTA